jgi:hypothetical protein
MSSEAYIAFAIGILVTIIVFYGLGLLLKKRWWILAIILSVILATCIVTWIVGINTPPPSCSEYAVLCISQEFVYALYALAIGIGTFTAIIFGLPAAFIASRRNKKTKK